MKNRYNDTVFSPGGTLESGHISGNEAFLSEDSRDERGNRRKLRNSTRNDFTRYSCYSISIEEIKYIIIDLSLNW